MASKIKVTPQKKEMLEEDGPQTPLLDLSDLAVKDLIRSARKRGSITHDRINALLSSGEVKSEQIEDILTKFGDIGINVVETKGAEFEKEVATGEGLRSRSKHRSAKKRIPRFGLGINSDHTLEEVGQRLRASAFDRGQGDPKAQAPKPLKGAQNLP